MVYFAQIGADGPIKIGFTDDLASRLSWHRSNFGVDLTLLLIIPGDRRTEREIQSRFAHLRIRRRPKGGRLEQFQPEPDLMAFIARREAKRLKGGGD